jgi:hypothetical protein
MDSALRELPENWYTFREKGVPLALSSWDDGLRLLKYPRAKSPIETNPIDLNIGFLVWSYLLESHRIQLGIPADTNQLSLKFGDYRFYWLQLCARIPEFVQFVEHDLYLSALLVIKWKNNEISEAELKSAIFKKRHQIINKLNPNCRAPKTILRVLRKIEESHFPEVYADPLSTFIENETLIENLKHAPALTHGMIQLAVAFKDEQLLITDLCRLITHLGLHHLREVRGILNHHHYLKSNPRALSFCQSLPQLISLSATFSELDLPQNANFRNDWLRVNSFQESERLYDNMIFNAEAMDHHETTISKRIYTYREFLPSPPVPGNVTIFHINTPEMLKREGTSMRNCCYSYLNKIYKGKSCFYHVNAGRGATLEMVWFEKYREWRVNEIKGPHNVNVDSAVLLAISNWLSGTYFVARVRFSRYLFTA